jgi:hypothetical protein
MKTKEIPFEVDCKDVVTSHCVKVRNMVTGAEFSAPAKEWHWRNSFYADVTFVFRGQEFTVCAEVRQVFPN